MADAAALKAADLRVVRVRVPLPASFHAFLWNRVREWHVVSEMPKEGRKRGMERVRTYGASAPGPS